MATTLTTQQYATTAATRPSAELHLAIYAASDALTADPNDTDNTDLTADDIAQARALTDACRAELARREQLHAQAIIEYAATKQHPRASQYVALQQAVNHLADLIRKHQLDGEDIHTLVCAIDYDESTQAETYWGEGLTDTFDYLTSSCTVLEESAETLLQEAGLTLGW